MIDTCRAAELSQAQMREVDGNPNPTESESVNVMRINKRGATMSKASGSQYRLVSVLSVELLMSLRKNSVLHMARGAISVGKIIILLRGASKSHHSRRR